MNNNIDDRNGETGEMKEIENENPESKQPETQVPIISCQIPPEEKINIIAGASDVNKRPVISSGESDEYKLDVIGTFKGLFDNVAVYADDNKMYMCKVFGYFFDRDLDSVSQSNSEDTKSIHSTMVVLGSSEEIQEISPNSALVNHPTTSSSTEQEKIELENRIKKSKEEIQKLETQIVEMQKQEKNIKYKYFAKLHGVFMNLNGARMKRSDFREDLVPNEIFCFSGSIKNLYEFSPLKLEQKEKVGNNGEDSGTDQRLIDFNSNFGDFTNQAEKKISNETNNPKFSPNNNTDNETINNVNPFHSSDSSSEYSKSPKSNVSDVESDQDKDSVKTNISDDENPTDFEINDYFLLSELGIASNTVSYTENSQEHNDSVTDLISESKSQENSLTQNSDQPSAPQSSSPVNPPANINAEMINGLSFYSEGFNEGFHSGNIITKKQYLAKLIGSFYDNNGNELPKEVFLDKEVCNEKHRFKGSIEIRYICPPQNEESKREDHQNGEDATNEEPSYRESLRISLGIE